MKVNKFEMCYNLMERWMTLREEGKSISNILNNRGIFIIAIYGLGKIGRHVICELENSSVIIQYAIDRAAAGLYGRIPVKSVEEELPNVDAVIVTEVYDFDEIEETLIKKMECPIISLEEILYEG